MSAVEVFRRLSTGHVARIHGMVGRGVVRRVTDTTRMQELQVTVLRGEVLERVERFQNYGFTGHPEPGAEHVVVAPGGNRGHALVIAVDDRNYRPTDLQEGEVAVYDRTGSRVTLKADGSIGVAPSSGEVAVVGNLSVTGNVTADGNVTAAGDVADATGTLDALRQTYNTHTHKENGQGGGLTDPPTQQA